MSRTAFKRLRTCRAARRQPDPHEADVATSVTQAPLEAPPALCIRLPHQILLEVLSYLESREIVRARSVARAFMSDAPALVDSLRCWAGQRFPTASSMDLFPRITEVHLNGDINLINQAAPGLVRCGALRRLTILGSNIPQQDPLPGETTAILCGLQLSELDIRRVRIEVPTGLIMNAWHSLDSLVLREVGINDSSIASLFANLAGETLPLRRLDLSRNLFGDGDGTYLMSEALRAFPHLETLELTADRISDSVAQQILGTLLDGSCPCLKLLELSLNFLGNNAINFLAEGLKREGHGLSSLERLGFGGRFMPTQGRSHFNSLGRSLAAGGLPLLKFLHLQGDVSLAEVGPLLRELRSGVIPNLAIVKVERSTRFPPEDDPSAVEDTIQSMLELVMCLNMPVLKEVHVLGMNLGKGLETGWAPEEKTAFYRATNMSSFHRLAAAGSLRGVMIFV